MLHYASPETELVREKDQRLAEGAFYGLQCGDSLAIAANHIGEDAFGGKKLLLRMLRVLSRSSW